MYPVKNLRYRYVYKPNKKASTLCMHGLTAHKNVIYNKSCSCVHLLGATSITKESAR